MVDSSSGEQTQPTRQAGEESAASLDDRIDALADERRRQAVACIARSDGPVPLDELADELADGDAGTSPLSRDPDHLSLRLHHVHLPKLADAGLAEYDEDRQKAAGTDAGDQLLSLLEEL